MIISASRRTDIPAFYSQWFINRIRAGYCAVPNPLNLKQVSHVSLQPAEVEAIVFWTRNPAPLLAHLQELDERGFRYHFLFTLINNPRAIDPHSPSLDKAVAAFRELAGRIGPERVIWRYDPIVLSSITPVSWHIDNFGTLAEQLAGATRRCFISFVDEYRKAARRIGELRRKGVMIPPAREVDLEASRALVAGLVKIAEAGNIEIQSCAQRFDLESLGVAPGKCIDDNLLRKLFGQRVSSRKDPAQRKECGCVVSRDIGMYDSCLFGCSYCYATRSFDLARRNYAHHDPASPSLLGGYDARPAAAKAKKVPKKNNCSGAGKQQRLF